MYMTLCTCVCTCKGLCGVYDGIYNTLFRYVKQQLDWLVILVVEYLIN